MKASELLVPDEIRCAASEYALRCSGFGFGENDYDLCRDSFISGAAYVYLNNLEKEIKNEDGN